MNKRPYITILLAALLISGILHSVAAQDILVGVKPGDVFTYSVAGSYSPSAPVSEIPEDVLNAEITDFFKVTIDNVTSPEIYYTWIWQFKNGTSMTNSSMLNIQTTGSTGPFWAIISANLSSGAKIHPFYGPDRSTINATTKWPYMNYTRETNRLQLEFAYQNNVTQATKIEHTDTYFDRQTGMLLELNDETNYQNPTFTTTIKWKLAETNAWTESSTGSLPPDPLFSLPVIVAIIVLVALLIVALAVWVSMRRKKARQKAILRKK